MPKRNKYITEAMEDQIQSAYLLCLDLVEKLYAGEKVSQAAMLNAVVRAWKIYNRFAHVVRHNLQLKYNLHSREEILSATRPNRMYKHLDTHDFPMFDFDRRAGLLSLARELLMEIVDYRTRKAIEYTKEMELLRERLGSVAYELRDEHNEHDPDYCPFGSWHEQGDDALVPEADTYLAGLKKGLEILKKYRSGSYDKIEPLEHRWGREKH